MDIEKVSFSSASSITDGKATPVPVVARQSRFKRLVLRLFSNSRSGSGKRKCFGLHNSSSPQFLAHTLNTLKAVQDQTSAATPRDFSFQMFENDLVLPQSRPFFDKAFGKGSLKDSSAFPAAVLPEFGNITLGIFVEWTYDRGIRLMQSDDDTSDEENSSREAIRGTIHLFMEILFFADRYSLGEFQDDFLELFIQLLRDDNSPLNIYHVRRFHRRTSQDSNIRVFLVDWVAFIIQEIDASGKLKGKSSALNGDLSLNKRETLVELLHLLEGGKIRPPHGKFPDPRDAPSCIYHHHSSGQKCRQRVLAGSFMSKDFKVKA
ncbi:uncharacterized protein EAE97_010326 [Botrytis byssoidea]|uniref:BTB domain-containing protein n=1 Tax=Botrytis byssoidea TaxID=139641 RepID=A0A9P5LVC1_9HELO|nr:uncharacterized protein EAE97_010326 [Botrytis byssoidea]KAF7926026.1 hypothetical protein EAE97_010326 [Botrytis byssoidea]